MQHFLDVTVGDAAAQHQRRRGSFDNYARMVAAPAPVGLGEAETDFLSAARQLLHRVGHRRWLAVRAAPRWSRRLRQGRSTAPTWRGRTGPATGSTSPLATSTATTGSRSSRSTIPTGPALKLLGHARFDPEPDPATLEQLGIDGRLEGLVTVEVVAFDWNCPKFITPRYTADEVRAATEPLRARIAELESVVASLGGQS